MVLNWHSVTKSLALTAAAWLVGLGAMGNAHAAVIATSLDSITNYVFGPPPEGTTVLESPNSSTSSDSATFNGVGPSNAVTCPGPPSPPCNPGGLSANAPQATAGAGPFPAEDTYTKPPPGGFAGSRGDANVRSVDFGGLNAAGASNVADSRLNGPSTGAANGTNFIVTNVTITQPTSLNFSFVANPFMQVAVGQAGDSAAAVLGAEISLVAANGMTVFLWTPGVSSGEIGVDSETDPFSLNQPLFANTPAGNAIFSPVVNPFRDVFRASSGVLSSGTYTLTFQMNEDVRAQEIAVPEPPALALLGFGLSVFGALGCRRLVARVTTTRDCLA